MMGPMAQLLPRQRRG